MTGATRPAGSALGAAGAGRAEARLALLDREAARSPAVGAPAGPRALPGSLAVFSRTEIVAQGVIALLSEEWQRRSTIVTELDRLERLVAGAHAAVVVDGDAEDARDAVLLTRSAGATVVLLLGRGSREVEPWSVELADAVLIRDELEPLTLRVALVVRRLGMRLLPQGLTPRALASQENESPSLTPLAQRVLALLAEGMRDADMARELNLSESAVRKLVQRTVHSIGARTRCQAVAISARAGG